MARNHLSMKLFKKSSNYSSFGFFVLLGAVAAAIWGAHPGPEVIKLFSCSTQLSILFKMLISIKISRFFLKSQINRECYFPAHKCYNANKCWHFNTAEQEKFHAHLS